MGFKHCIEGECPFASHLLDLLQFSFVFPFVKKMDDSLTTQKLKLEDIYSQILFTFRSFGLGLICNL